MTLELDAFVRCGQPECRLVVPTQLTGSDLSEPGVRGGWAVLCPGFIRGVLHKLHNV